MTEAEALARMVAPGTPRPGKWRGSVIQILVTSACNLACAHCTQASNLQRKPWFMTPEQFEQAVLSLRGYQGVYGTFGGCPTISPHFEDYCRILQQHVPKEQCGLWANNLMGKGALCRATYDPAISNLNVHLDQKAYDEIRATWPEARPFGLHEDSRHGPVFVAMKDVLQLACNECSGNGGYYDRANGERYLSDPEDGSEWQRCPACEGTGKVYDEERAWELISRCDINQHWSALVGVFRGELRAWFCEVAGAQAMLHQDEPDYPDTGTALPPPGHIYNDYSRFKAWWEQPMEQFAHQVRQHCHSCSVPLRGYGQLAMAPSGSEQTSATHASVIKPKRKGRNVEVVTHLEQLGMGRLARATEYLQNAKR